MNTREKFFYDNAGYCIRAGQTEEEARLEGARQLAAAEDWAEQQGYVFQWSPSDIDSLDFSDDEFPYRLWDCVMRDGFEGEVLQALGAVDFGCRIDPNFHHPEYKRVVEGELALQQRATK